MKKGKKGKVFLTRYLPCIDECKRNKNGIFQCRVDDGGWKYTESCQRYEDLDAMKIERADLDILSELWNVLEDLITGNLARATERSVVVALAVFSLIGTGISSIINYFNSDQIKKLNQQRHLTTQNDIIMSKSLRVIYSFQNDTTNNIQKISNATQELILAESVTERRIQIHEIDDHRKAHVDTNYKLMYLGIKTVLTILEKALHGKLSTDIALVFDVKGAYNRFEKQAKRNGYQVPANAFAHIFQMPTSYFYNKEDNSINLIVHIPLKRDNKAFVMHKYIGTTIPITSHHRITLESKEDIIAFGEEKYVTLKSEDLWKCPKIATVHFLSLIHISEPTRPY